MFKKVNLALLAIVILAAVLRLVNLGTIPIGFNDDEAAFGYNAYSILKTGHDEWGKFLPFPAFESFGDWKLVFYLYLTVASVAIFGLNELAVRFPSAIVGVLAVLTTYFLAKKLFETNAAPRPLPPKFEIARPAKPWRSWGNLKLEIAHVSALLLAISPWHIAASRNAFESDLLTFTITLSTYLFLKGLANHKFITLSFICFAASFYIYRSSWLFVPLFLISLIYFFRKKLVTKTVLKNLLLMVILLLPLVPIVTSSKGQSRFFQESFITSTARIGITNEINEKRGICANNFPAIFCQLIFNKYLLFTKIYIANYVQNLSFNTYFEKANPTGFQSFATRGVFYLFEFPLLIIGLIGLLSNQSTATKILIPWLLLAPIGASFAGIGNYGRINLIMPAPQIVTAYGLVFLASFLKSNLRSIFVFTMALVILTSLARFVVELFYIEPYYTSRYQRYGYKQLFDYLGSQKKYQKFYISQKIDNSHQYIQYLFFRKVDPSFYLQNAQRHRGDDGWIVFNKIERFEFPPSVPPTESIPQGSLLVVGEKETLFPVPAIHTIDDVKGDRLFEIYDMDEVKKALEGLNQT